MATNVLIQLKIEKFFVKDYEHSYLLYLTKSNLVPYHELLIIFDEMLSYILDETKYVLINWINIKVPKRTGQLRETLIEYLNVYSRVQNGILSLELGSPADYMTELNNMSTSVVRHFKEWGWADYYGYKGRILLDDPFAIGKFWDNLITFALDKLTNITQRAIDEFFGGTGKLMKGIRGKLITKVKVYG